MNITHTSDTVTDLIPEYSGFPVVGVLPDLFRQQPFEFMRNVIREHGDLVKLNVGPQAIYLVSNPDYLQHILRDNHHNYQKPDLLYKAAKKVIGNGLVISTGDFWLRQRRMMQPYFHRKFLVGLTDVMTSGIGEILDTWEPAVRSSEVMNMGNEMSRITMNIITKTMFGLDLPAEDMAKVFHDMPRMIDHATIRGYLPFLPDWFPIPGDSQFEKSLENVRDVVMRIIEQRRQDSNDANDLITMLLHAVDEETNEQMTDEQIFDEAMTIFLAGFETTSTALTWLWHLLDQNPQVEQKLRAEITTVLGDGVPTLESIRQLTYTKMVFQETMRMFPPVPLLPRVAVEADRLGDFAIPEKATLVLFFYGVHHNEKVWEQPDVFDPERFTPERSKGRSQFAYLPFSGGPRQCIGNEFAYMEGVLAMAMMLQRYRVSLLPDHKVTPKLSITLRPANGIKGTIRHS